MKNFGFEIKMRQNLSPIQPCRIVQILRSKPQIFQPSFSHLPVFLHLTGSDSGKAYTLWTLFEVWRDHKQMIVVIIDRMLSCCILTPSSVIDWVLNPALSDELSRSWLWRIACNTLKKMNKHVIKECVEIFF